MSDEMEAARKALADLDAPPHDLERHLRATVAEADRLAADLATALLHLRCIVAGEPGAVARATAYLADRSKP